MRERASDWLVNLRALRCSTTERKTGAMFLLLCDLGHSRDSFVPVAFCISARTDFLVSIFRSKDPSSCSSCYGCYTFSRNVITTLFISCVLFCIRLYGVYD